MLLFFLYTQITNKKISEKKIKRKESRSKRDMSEEPDEQKLVSFGEP